MFVCSQVGFFGVFFMRYFCLIIFFLPLFCFGKVECVENDDGTWTCSGDGFPVYPPGTVITNVLGVCTNCTAMSPDQCYEITSSLRSEVIQINSSINQGIGQLSSVDFEIHEFTDKWDEMQVNVYNTSSLPPGYDSSSSLAVTQWQEDQIQYQYLVNNLISNTLNGSTRGAGLNSIANYYQQVVKPFVESLQSRNNQSMDMLRDAQGSSSSLLGLVNQIDCSQCTATPEGPGLPYPGDPGSGGGGGSSESCCAPCVEQLVALKEVTSSIDYKVRAISNSVASIEREFKAYSKTVLSALNTISNSVYRLDSYVTQDLKNSVEQITNSLVVIERNVDGIQRDFYLAMSNAQHFVSMGGKEWDPVEISTNFFEVGEYKDLPWASRVEALLLNLAKPFDPSSTPEGVTKETMDEVVEKVSELQSAVDPASLSSAYSTQFDKVRQAFSSFDGLFQGDSTGTVSFGAIGEHDLTFSIDGNVLSACRTVFSLIWYAGALVALFFIVPFLWSLSLGSFKFLWHLLTLLVK